MGILSDLLITTLDGGPDSTSLFRFNMGGVMITLVICDEGGSSGCCGTIEGGAGCTTLKGVVINSLVCDNVTDGTGGATGVVGNVTP